MATTIVLSDIDVSRIFQALATERDRLAKLDPRWHDQATVDHADRLLERFRYRAVAAAGLTEGTEQADGVAFWSNLGHEPDDGCDPETPIGGAHGDVWYLVHVGAKVPTPHAAPVGGKVWTLDDDGTQLDGGRVMTDLQALQHIRCWNTKPRAWMASDSRIAVRNRHTRTVSYWTGTTLAAAAVTQ